MSEPGLISQIDEGIGTFFAQWNIASTLIAGLLLIVFIYPLFTSKEPDTHPFLLARQAQASPIRQLGESATYRSTEIPYGYPLRSGLAFKDPGASKWTTGRDGDLRDIWRQAVSGAPKEDGTTSGGSAKITTVHGVEKIIEHDLKDLTRDINIIGEQIQHTGASKVAMCLSNSVELLCTVFAGAFYNFSPILIPYHQHPDEAASILGTTEFDTLIAEAGSVAVDKLLSKSKSIKRIIWVAKEGSKHLDWNVVPEGVGSKLDIVTWHELVEDKKHSASNEVPSLDKDSKPLPVLAFWPTKSGNFEMIEYTQKNLIAGVAALQSSMPRLHKLSPSDSVLLTAPLNTSYALCFAILTLFTGSTLLLTSVSGPKISLLNATKSARERLKPTHIIADVRAMPRFVEDLTQVAGKGGIGAKYAVWGTGRAINQGYMPAVTSKPSYLPSSLSALKMLYIVQPDVIGVPERLRSSTLAELRILLSARVSLALTTGQVAGYVAQTNVLDYRDKGVLNCVGPVAASLELSLVGKEEEVVKTDGTGEIAVKGPSVVSRDPKEKVVLRGLKAMIDGDNTVVLVQH